MRIRKVSSEPMAVARSPQACRDDRKKIDAPRRDRRGIPERVIWHPHSGASTRNRFTAESRDGENRSLLRPEETLKFMPVGNPFEELQANSVGCAHAMGKPPALSPTSGLLHLPPRGTLPKFPAYSHPSSAA